jgi:hypothetical protein
LSQFKSKTTPWLPILTLLVLDDLENMLEIKFSTHCTQN